MPLKHHTETAYMLLLGLVTCAVGFLIALLPSFPAAVPYWGVLFIVTFFYPILLIRTFKENRADYEFRMMHWFPFCMTVLWIVLQFLAPKARILTILQLGFFFLWSLPLVALGITFLILFAVHVIRRSRVRILFLSLFLAVFTAGAVASEAMGWDSRIQAALYPAHPEYMSMVRGALTDLRSAVATITGTTEQSSSVSSSAVSASSMKTSSSSSSKRSTMIAAASSRSTSSLSSSMKPVKLPQSGPESAGVLGATLIALYMGTVHLRARRRV